MTGVVILPWPPSGNRTARHTRSGGHYTPAEVIRFRHDVAWCCKGVPIAPGRYVLEVFISPPDKRDRDIDNALKNTLDALVKAGWLPDDSMRYMRELHVYVHGVLKGGRITARWRPFPVVE